MSSVSLPAVAHPVAPAASGSGVAVALADWNWDGHHKVYLRRFAECLLGLGYKVIILTSEPGKFAGLEKAWPGAVATGLLQENCLRWRWPQPLRSWLLKYKRITQFRENLAQAEARLGVRCRLVVLNHLDLTRVDRMARLADALEIPWTGLFLQVKLDDAEPGAPDMRRLLQHPRLRAFAVLEEQQVDPCSRSTGRQVVRFPDIADGFWTEDHANEKQLRTFARGRPLVLAIGRLTNRRGKGILTLARVALQPENRDIAFVFAGWSKWSLFSDDERALLEQARATTDNILFKSTDELGDDLAYNACIRAADVIFAAYEGFPHSSNTLTKAAIFRKPVIVSDGQLMGARAREFHLGEIVPERDLAAISRAIRRLTDDYPAWLAANRPQWEAYYAQHSQEALADSFRQLLAVYGLPAPAAREGR
jgi:glycosyltransferase involved in cell wall biosynthesis